MVSYHRFDTQFSNQYFLYQVLTFVRFLIFFPIYHKKAHSTHTKIVRIAVIWLYLPWNTFYANSN